MSRSNYWCFTLNNYNDTDKTRLSDLVPDSLSFLIYGEEIGDSGTPHLQGYAEFKTRVRFSKAKSVLGNRCHLEKRKGSSEQAAAYCEKDGAFTRLGEISKSSQGKRSDLDDLHKSLKEKRPMSEIADEHFGQFLKYQRGINAYRLVTATRRDWAMSVVVYHGKTGAGKTRAVYDNLPAAEELYVHPGGPWFDGYDQQPIVLFDDYAGSEFKLQYLLKLLDRYPMQVPVKGGFVSFVPREVYITSNLHPEDWYRNANPEHVQAMLRRITNTVYFQ